MAQYINVDGYTKLQLDDGTTVDAVVPLSLEGGILAQLLPDQIAELQAIALPETYPLPSAQITDLKTVTVGNFPATFDIGNFPAGFQVSNLPSTFPLPPGQETFLSSISGWVLGLDKGSGTATANTLRAAIANFPTTYALPTAQENILTAIQTQVEAFDTGSGSTTANTLRSHISNLPPSYPLSLAQEAILTGINTRLDALTKGSGSTDSNTLRAHVANLPLTFALPTEQADLIGTINNQLSAFDRNIGPSSLNTLRTVAAVSIGPCSISSVTAAVTSTAIAAASSTRRILKVYNDSGGILYLAIGANTASTSSWSVKLFPDDYWEAEPEEAGLQITGWFTVATGSAKVTTG